MRAGEEAPEEKDPETAEARKVPPDGSLESVCKAWRKVGRRVAAFLMVLFLAIGFHFVVSLDPTVLIRQVQVPKPGQWMSYVFDGKFSSLLNEDAWQSMPEPWPDFNNSTVMNGEMKAARNTYSPTLIALQFGGVVVLGTFALLVPLPCFPSDDSDGEGLTSEQLELFTHVSVVMYLIMCIKVTLQGALYHLLSNRSGLAWEAYYMVMTVGELMMLFQVVVVRIVRPRAKFKTGAFGTCTISTLMPMLADTFDTLKDCIFAGLAVSTGTPVGIAIGVVSYAYIIGLHAYMMTDPELQLELRASYSSVLCLAPLPDEVRSSGVKAETSPSTGRGLARECWL